MVSVCAWSTNIFALCFHTLLFHFGPCFGDVTSPGHTTQRVLRDSQESLTPKHSQLRAKRNKAPLLHINSAILYFRTTMPFSMRCDTKRQNREKMRKSMVVRLSHSWGSGFKIFSVNELQDFFLSCTAPTSDRQSCRGMSRLETFSVAETNN